MKRVKRTAVIVIPKQPYIDWAKSLEDGGVKLVEGSKQEHTIYLVEDATDYIPNQANLLKPHFKSIFEEELNSWHQLESDWPANRDWATFLAWFEVEIHSLVLDLHRGRLKTERY